MADSLLRDFGINGFAGLRSRKEALARSNNPEVYRRIRSIQTSISGITVELSYGVSVPRWDMSAYLDNSVARMSILPNLPGLPGEEEMRWVLTTYYDAIDRGDVETVLALFSNDRLGEPTVRYKRGTQPEVVGADKLRQFFEKDRIIESGEHELISVMIDDESGTGRVEGSFRGVLKSQELVDIVFNDRFEFLGSKIIYRRSTFPGKEV